MQPQDLKFSVNQLIIAGRDTISCADFELIQLSDLETLSISKMDGTSDILQIKKAEKTLYEDRFVALSFEEGEKYPYSEKTINTTNLSESDNARSAEDIELNNQTFVLVDCEKYHIYLSDQRKRKIIQDWLSQKLSVEATIKPIFFEGDFMEMVETVRSVSLTVDADSGTPSEASLSAVLAHDAYGYGAATASLNLTYKSKKLTTNIKNKLAELIKKKSDFKNVTVVGKTLDGFERIFNTNEIVNKIPVTPMRDEKTGKFNVESVFQTLILKLRKQELNDEL